METRRMLHAPETGPASSRRYYQGTCWTTQNKLDTDFGLQLEPVSTVAHHRHHWH